METYDRGVALPPNPELESQFKFLGKICAKFGHELLFLRFQNAENSKNFPVPLKPKNKNKILSA